MKYDTLTKAGLEAIESEAERMELWEAEARHVTGETNE